MSVHDQGQLADQAHRRSMVTPEGVDLNLQIGDAGQRLGAFVIDVVLQYVLLFIFGVLCFAAAAALNFKDIDGVGVLYFLGAFIIRNAWFIGFELTPKAATIGKRIMGLRVASRDGGPLTAEAVITRNAMREVEIFLPVTMIFAATFTGGTPDGLLYLSLAIWMGIFLFLPLFNRDRLRAGDLIAGTWVVRTPKRRLLPDLVNEDAVAHSRFTFTDEQLKAYGVKELHVLEQVLRNRDRKTMAAVALRIRRKIGWTAEMHERDDEFLEAYYATLRQRLEQRMLFGHRRKDKHDEA